ncbi:TadE/TadG family type IV pilus assembly protein [Sulfitobacter aestuarii]|uniref:TadE/TadG family type IV pilus assembly protein n=1 Tax=Sulfitobacter aestuarii TaxID=2161676 RepID=A0ABW5TY76_9RHOB
MLRAKLNTTRRALRRSAFLTREDGNITIEAMIMMPLLFWTYLAMFTFFDAFHQNSLNQKAAFTIGDAISRETNPINDAYLDGAKGLFDYLVHARGDSSLRVSSIRYDLTTDKFYRDWSQVRGSVPPLSNDDVAQAHAWLPAMPDREYVVLVETWNNFEPVFNVGLEQRDIHNVVFTRPRYASCVLWDDGGEDTENTCISD